jgi:MinD superfamily P-loop ATPase
MNTLDLLGKHVRCNGEMGIVVNRSEPGSSRRDRLAAERGRSVTIRIDGQLAPHFVEVTESDPESIEVLDE